MGNTNREGYIVMKNFGDLSQKELEYICERIPFDVIRNYFQKNPKEFGKIKSGFRPETLSDRDTLDTFVKNVNKPFVTAFIESTVTRWLEQIQDNINKLENAGYSAGEALLKTIPNCFFADCPSLYFKLVNRDVNNDYIQLLKDALSFAEKISKNKSASEEKNISTSILLNEANVKIDELNAEIERYKEHEKILNNNIKELKLHTKTCNDEVENINSKLKKAEENLYNMQSELEHYKRLCEYVDDEFRQDEFWQFQYVSIGQISHDYNGQIWINRLADISDGEIQLFIPDDNAPHYFENRDRLYWKNGPATDGEIAIWSWRADPRDVDPSKDYIKSEYNRNTKFTEVIEFPQCKNLTDIAKYITQWFEKTFISDKVLFVCTTSSGIKEGLLCSPGNLECSGTKVRLDKSVFMLPHYTVRFTDTIKLAGIRVFRKMNLGIPQSVYRVRTPFDAIKEMLLSRASITHLRENGWSKKEAQRCRNYLENIPKQTIVQELAETFACKEQEAKEYVDSFFNSVDSYLTSSDFDTQILAVALERNTDLIMRCKEQLTDEWRKENSTMFELAQEELKEAEKATVKERKDAEVLIKQKSELAEEINGINNKIEEKKRLALEVESKIAKRIEEAKKNAAEFISQMAFVSPVREQSSSEKSNGKKINIYKSLMPCVNGGNIDDIDTFEEELIANFNIIGYREEVSIEMAQTISFGIGNHIPIVIGDNSTSIGQCVAATIKGGELSEIFISSPEINVDSLTETIRNEIQEHENRVILIHGVFDSYSIGVYNVLVNRLKCMEEELVVFLSIEGISLNMIPSNVWSTSFYINGDEGLDMMACETVNSFDISMSFKRKNNDKEFKVKKKELTPFASIIGNRQANLYALYLSYYNLDLNESYTILKQMIAVALSLGKEEMLNSCFIENGISYGEKLIEKFL